MAESLGSYTVGAASAEGIQWKAIKREELPLYQHYEQYCEKTEPQFFHLMLEKAKISLPEKIIRHFPTS